MNVTKSEQKIYEIDNIERKRLNAIKQQVFKKNV